jgi:hypothetical protein
MKLDQDEVQIVKGPEFWVTDKRVVFKSCEILMNTIAAPQLEERIVSASAQVGVMAIGGVMLAGGLLVQYPIIWIMGGLVCAVAPLANVKRKGIALTVESAGERKVIYETTNLNDAKLAFAAIEEALLRSAA